MYSVYSVYSILYSVYSIFKKNSIIENLNQTIKQSTPGFVSGVIIGIFSTVVINFPGWNKISETIISENMVLYTPVLFFSFVSMSWGIYYFLWFFDLFSPQCFSCIIKILLNISRCFVNYTSVTLGINISIWICLLLISFWVGDVGSIAMIKKFIYNPGRIISLIALCVVIFWPYSGSRSNEVRNKSPKSLCSKILGVPYVERKRYITLMSLEDEK
jgi:hypothetical protein